MGTRPAASLSRFQDEFSRALAAEPPRADPSMAYLFAQPAFAVYRNTVTKGCIDALQANFPSVARLVGEEWFRAAAAVFVAKERPAQPSLLAYGDSFPAFLAAFPPAGELPYLPGVARLDRSWTEAHAAADAPVLARADLATAGHDALADAILHPHPAARWAWFDDAPVFSIWRRNREESTEEGDIDWRAEGALLTRPADAVHWTAIDAAAHRFLEACSGGHSVARAMEAALAAQADANLIRVVTDLLDAGAFSRLSLPSRDDS